MRLTIVKEGRIVEDYEFQEDHLITIISEYHSEDPCKEEKFENDLQDAYQTHDLKKHDLVATEYTYFQNHFNVRKTWFFLTKKKYKKIEITPNDEQIVIKGDPYVRSKNRPKSDDSGGNTRPSKSNRKSERSEGGNVRKRGRKKDLSLLRSESERVGTVLATNQTDEGWPTTWRPETLEPDSGLLVWSGIGTDRSEEPKRMEFDGSLEESHKIQTSWVLAQVE
jgi:hypothetical protein